MKETAGKLKERRRISLDRRRRRLAREDGRGGGGRTEREKIDKEKGTREEPLAGRR